MTQVHAKNGRKVIESREVPMKVSTNSGNVVQMFERVSGGKNTDSNGGGAGSNAYEQNKKDQEDT